MTNLIETAVAPLKADAIARAEQEARALIAHIYRRLEECGWDANIVAPYPSSMMDRKTYASKKGQHNLYRTVTEPAKGYRTPRDPDLRIASEERVELFVANAKRFAGEQYDAFVAKLTAKIGAVDDAVLNGNHVWGHSILSVRKGETLEHWKTQQIVNVSKLGTLFNQWPTRKVK